jgi:hypothetical protein
MSKNEKLEIVWPEKEEKEKPRILKVTNLCTFWREYISIWASTSHLFLKFHENYMIIYGWVNLLRFLWRFPEFLP